MWQPSIRILQKTIFYNKKHQTVEISQLNWSIRAGTDRRNFPNVIVDIVETGSTLRENGLVVLEEVCPLIVPSGSQPR